MAKTGEAAGFLGDPSTEAAEPASHRRPTFVLRLYVAGGAPRSAWAIRNVSALCEAHLAGCHDLEIIDIHQQPELAREAQLLAAPTLIKHLPLPLRRFIGTMADTDRILVSLDVTRDPPEEGQR